MAKQGLIWNFVGPAAGALFGTAVAMLTMGRQGETGERAVSAKSGTASATAGSAHATPVVVVQPSDEGRLLEIERQLTALGDSGRELQTAVDGGAAMEDVAGNVQSWKSTHAAAARDPVWAPKASVDLSEDLKAIAETSNAFRVIDVDCKTSTCVANLEFTNSGTATKTWRSLLTKSYRVNCATTILLHSTDNTEAAFREQLMFDCKEARWPSQ